MTNTVYKMQTLPDTVKQLTDEDLDKGIPFVMSTATPDRVGDVVLQNHRLAQFKKNPIALFGHSSKEPIGMWKSLRVVEEKLQGVLKIAAQGTSYRINEIRSLVKQGILRAVSIGFIPHKAEPIDEDNPWGGYYLDDNELLECSLVSVPANSEALMVQSKSLYTAQQRLLSQCNLSAVRQLGGPKSVEHINTGKPSITIVQGNTSVTLHDTKRIALDTLL